MEAPRVLRLIAAVLLTALVIVPPRAAATDAGEGVRPPAGGLEAPREAEGGVFGL